MSKERYLTIFATTKGYKRITSNLKEENSRKDHGRLPRMPLSLTISGNTRKATGMPYRGILV